MDWDLHRPNNSQRREWRESTSTIERFLWLLFFNTKGPDGSSPFASFTSQQYFFTETGLSHTRKHKDVLRLESNRTVSWQTAKFLVPSWSKTKVLCGLCGCPKLRCQGSWGPKTESGTQISNKTKTTSKITRMVLPAVGVAARRRVAVAALQQRRNMGGGPKPEWTGIDKTVRTYFPEDWQRAFCFLPNA